MNNHLISKGEKIFHFVNLVIVTLLAFICLFPFLNVLATAFSDDSAIATGLVTIFPVDFQIEAFKQVLRNQGVVHSLAVTVLITLAGTAFNMLLTTITAYPLSRPDLAGRGKIMVFIIITMLFNGGMIPTFLVVKNLGMIDTPWALILPGALNTFNLIVLRTFFQSVPMELQEAARMDGCGNIRTLFSIMIPLSLPSLATLTLFYAVAHWNEFFYATLYIDNPDWYTLQVKLRQLLLLGQQAELNEGIQGSVIQLNEESLKSSTIIFSTIPILVVYPWLQKYFVKGVMVGAVKG